MSGTTTTSLDQATASDAELIAATRAGDDDAFSLLYRRHAGAARAAARTLMRSRAGADDLVAEGFTRILAALRRGTGPDVAFRPYLLACVRNAAYDRYRQDRREDLTLDPGAGLADPVLVDPALLAGERQMVARAFTSLPDRWQAVLWHTEVEGMPPASVAPILGLSANAVAALSYRAREGLRQAYLQAHLGAATPASCRVSRNQLGRYVRDGLSPTERASVDRHLESCVSCRALLAELTDVDTSLRSAMVPLVVGGPAGAYLAGLGAGGLGANAVGAGGLGAITGAGLAAASVLKVGLTAAAVLALAGVVTIAAYNDRPGPASVTTSVTAVSDGTAGEDGVRGNAGSGTESSPIAPGGAGAPANQGTPGASSPGALTVSAAGGTTVVGGAVPTTALLPEAPLPGAQPTVTAPAPAPPPGPSLTVPPLPPTLPPLPTLPTSPPLPTTLPPLPTTLPPLPTTLPPLPTTLPTLPPLPTTLPPLPTTLPTLPSLPSTLPTLAPLP